jgi:CRISPR-associated protein Cmr4
VNSEPFLLHSLTPLHAGTGQSADIIDLPIARMRATGIPFVPGSSLKGVLRDACDADNGGSLDRSTIEAIFGPPTGEAERHAGAVVVGDARLLCLPVRSFRGTFAFVTSPLLLQLAARDLPGVPAVPTVTGTQAVVPSNSRLCHADAGGRRVWFEDVDLEVRDGDQAASAWADWLAARIAGDDQPLRAAVRGRFAVVDDDTMTFLWETATQIDTRVAIDDETRTVKDGALWIEESLPPETVLVGTISADRRRDGKAGSPADVLDAVFKGLPESRRIQVGGKATVGRGVCRFLRYQEAR